jgi:hypothetical protein
MGYIRLGKNQIKINYMIMSIEHRIRKCYQDLYRNDEADLITGLALLEFEIKQSKDVPILEFSDWELVNKNKHPKNNRQDWYLEFAMDLLARSARFNLIDSFTALYEFLGMNKDKPSFMTILENAIEYSSLDIIDYLMSTLTHPDVSISDTGMTIYAQSLVMGNPIIAEHLLTTYSCNADGMSVFDDGTLMDYTGVIETGHSSSILVSIMISTCLNDFEKLSMMNFAVSKGASVNGYSQSQEACFDSPLGVASCLNIDFVDYLISIGASPDGSELFLAIDSNKTSFEQKRDIIEVYFAMGFDVNIVSKEGYSLLEQTIISNSRNASEMIDYLILIGDEYDSNDWNSLLILANERNSFSLRDHLFLNYGGSSSLYSNLLLDEESYWEENGRRNNEY